MKSALLTGPQKSMAVKAWNEGKTLPDIASILRNRSSVIEAYLKSRTGYPGKIPPRRPELSKPPGSPRTAAARKMRTEPAGEEETKALAERQVESRKPITLPAMPWDAS